MATTKQPLYKVLNEQRTQGILTVDNGAEPDLTLWIKKPEPNPGNISECIATVWANDKTEANAQYTALAVNNLANLADEMQNFIDNVIYDKKIYENQLSYFTRRFREALTRIS